MRKDRFTIILAGVLIFQNIIFLRCKDSKWTSQSGKKKQITVVKPSEYVGSTAFQTSEHELSRFKLADGFKISFFASEPDIGKPIKMEFDENGRLRLAQSAEYAVPARRERGETLIFTNPGYHEFSVAKKEMKANNHT